MFFSKRKKVGTVYFYYTWSRPPTDTELEKLKEEDLYKVSAYFIWEKTKDKKFLSLWRKAKKQNAKVVRLGPTIILSPEVLGFSLTDIQWKAHLWNSTNTFAKHEFEQRLETPLQEDRYFSIILGVGDDDCDLMVGAAIYFSG